MHRGVGGLQQPLQGILQGGQQLERLWHAPRVPCQCLKQQRRQLARHPWQGMQQWCLEQLNNQWVRRRCALHGMQELAEIVLGYSSQPPPRLV